MNYLSRKLVILLGIIFVISIIPFTSALAFSGTGTGTNGDPYLIANCVQLQEMSGDLTGHYKLAGNINCSDTSNWNGGAGFASIGNEDTPFTGSFDGDGHTILHLFINNPSTAIQGLFGEASGGTIANVTVTGSVTGQDYTGGVIGYGIGETITNVHSSVTVTGHDKTGGVVGEITPNNSALVSNSSFQGTVSGYQYVGGLIGEIEGAFGSSNIFVQSSYSTGTVVASGNAGGLIGFINGGIVQNSYSQSNVTENGDLIGGFGGLIGYAGAGATIRKTYASGTVIADTSTFHDIGGLVGGLLLANGDITIADSFSLVTGSAAEVNGLYGSNITAGNNIVLTNNYYDVSNSGSHTCYSGSNQDETGCTGIDVNNSTYWKNTANAPLTQWSTGIWNIGTYTLPVITANYSVADTTAPTVVSVSPTNGATNVHGNVPIIITFSEPMDTSSLAITTDGCVSNCHGYDQVWSSGDTVLTLTLQGAVYDPHTTYDFGIHVAKDVAQNNIAAEYDFSFTTGNAPTITQTAAIPSPVLPEDAVYHFTTSEACEILAEEVQGPGQVELRIDQSPTPGADLVATFRGLVVNGTYSTAIQCMNSNHLVSNSLAIGPFTVIGGPGVLTGGGGSPIVQQSTLATTSSPITTVHSAPMVPSRTLKINMSGPDVIALQQYLNRHGFAVIASGPGSAGHETLLFGSLTKKAVMKFQKAHGLSADGVVGPKTRALMI